MEKELAEEKEKVRSLEAELVRVHTEAIADFKKSQEYEELLAVEYDASFPDTFKSCWEAIIEELGSKIDEVTLEKFLVPLVPRKTATAPRKRKTAFCGVVRCGAGGSCGVDGLMNTPTLIGVFLLNIKVLLSKCPRSFLHRRLDDKLEQKG